MSPGATIIWPQLYLLEHFLAYSKDLLMDKFISIVYV